MFENVNYDFYSDTLGRSTVPDETTFNNYVLENKAYMKTILPFVEEKETNGIDSTVCLWCEEQYKAEQNGTAYGEKTSSENVGSYSYSTDNSKTQSLVDRKNYWLNLFCNVNRAVF